MDFSKAFDKVDHQRLLLKLHRLGINTGVITWIQSFLSGRSQRVVLDGETSDACPVLSGVPQGSVLGPCLFLMYINDMPENIQSNIRLFADDTIMYLTITNQSDCQDLQRDLSKLEIWELAVSFPLCWSKVHSVKNPDHFAEEEEEEGVAHGLQPR